MQSASGSRSSCDLTTQPILPTSNPCFIFSSYSFFTLSLLKSPSYVENIVEEIVQAEATGKNFQSTNHLIIQCQMYLKIS